MAIYSLNMTSRTCGSGQSAIARAAYVSASKLKSERTGESFDHRRKADVKHTEMNFPEGTPVISREDFWNAVEADITTKGCCYGKTGYIALPREWSDEQRIKFARLFLNEMFVSKGHVVDWAYHDKGDNPHIDYFVSQKRYGIDGKFIAPKMKEVFANDRDRDGKPIFNEEKPAYDPKRKEETNQYRLPQIDKKTGEQKVRVRKGKGTELLWEKVKIEDESLNSKDFLLQFRQSWQDFANERLDPEHHIDCRTLEEQEIDRVPQIHVGPAGYAMHQKNPGSSDRYNINEEIKESNKEIDGMESEHRTLRQLLQEKRNKVILDAREKFKAFWERLQASVQPQKEDRPDPWQAPKKRPDTTPAIIKKFRKPIEPTEQIEPNKPNKQRKPINPSGGGDGDPNW